MHPFTQVMSKGIYLIDLFVLREFRGQSAGIELLKAIAQKGMTTNSQWIA